MSNSRKAVLVALAGVAAVGAGKAGHQVVRHAVRRRKMAKLRAWYYSELKKIDEYVDIGVDRYMTTLRQAAQSKNSAVTQILDRRTVRWLRAKAREVIVANEQAQITKEYGVKMYDLDPKLAYAEELKARDLMFKAADFADEISNAGHSPNALFLHLHMQPPE